MEKRYSAGKRIIFLRLAGRPETEDGLKLEFESVSVG